MVFLRVSLLTLSLIWAHVHLISGGRHFFHIEQEISSQNFRLLSRCATLGFFELGADRAWIQFVNYFGDKQQHNKRYPYLFSFLERAQILDPYFLQIYQRMGLLSSLTDTRSDHVLNLLAEGQLRQPRDWLIPFLRASLLMQEKGSLNEAAQVMRVAAERPGAPDYLGLLSIRLATAGGDLAAALTVVAQLEHEATDEMSLEILAERRRQITYEEQLRAFAKASHQFHREDGTSNFTLEALRKTCATLPEQDPWGEDYVLGKAENITSASVEKRLRLADTGK